MRILIEFVIFLTVLAVFLGVARAIIKGVDNKKKKK